MAFAVRDLIYLDVERLKSIIAQLEKGLVDASSETKSSARETDARAEGGIPAVLGAAGGVRFLWEKEESQTKTLHDYIYNKVEEALLARGLLVRIPADITLDTAKMPERASLLSDTTFVLARGRIVLNDYSRMRLMLENFNKLGKFTAWASSQGAPRQEPRPKERPMSLDKDTVEGMKLILDLFYKDRVVIKVLPFPDISDFRLVGNLDRAFLRDDIDSITYKFGTAPLSEWVAFGQIAALPPEERPPEPLPTSGADMDLAMEKVFAGLRQLELMVGSVVYPEIAFSPIAVYRE